MSSITQHGYLVLADISGYTSFVAGTELEHAQAILGELLESIITRFKARLTISKIEGDGDKVLTYLSSETGGQPFFPFKAQELAQSFENIANELRHQYNVLYRPEPLKTDGLYHPVDVRVKGRKDLVVRARHGYYAPKL